MFVLYYTISEPFAYDSPACVNYWKIMEKEGIKRKVFLSKSRQEKKSNILYSYPGGGSPAIWKILESSRRTAYTELRRRIRKQNKARWPNCARM